jgi:hypothetical protein
MRVLTNYVQIAKREGIPATDALSRMAFQTLVGLRETGQVEGGERRGVSLLLHLFSELAKVLKERGYVFVYRIAAESERHGGVET